MLSTDDMSFCGYLDFEYYELPIFDYSNISSETKELLLKYFNEEDTNKILYKNAYNKIIDKLNDKKE